MGSSLGMKVSETMVRFFASLSFVLGSFAAFPAAHAGEVTLTIPNMVCPVCSYRVKSALERVSGVTKAVISIADKTAIVSYDDTKVDVPTLTRATAKAGFPSARKS